MLNVGSPELLVILVVALLVLGPNKLPEAARQVGKAMGELRRLSSGFQAELRDAMQEPVIEPPPFTQEPATVVEPPAVVETTLTLDPDATVAGPASGGAPSDPVPASNLADPELPDEAPPA